MSILKKAPEGARVYDLAGARAARAEARVGVELPLIKLTAGFVQMLPEVDLRAAEDFAAGNMRAGLSRILADPEDAAALLDGGLSAEDLKEIVGFASGMTLGE